MRETTDPRLLSSLALCPTVLVALLVLACGAAPEEPRDASWRPGDDRVDRPTADVLDDGGAAEIATAARFLAGLPARSEDLDLPAELAAASAEHAGAMEAAWQRLASEHLGAINQWSARELADLEDGGAPLFYPFGGPDFLNALHLFPEASTYVLVGLENPGRIPRLADMARADVDGELARLRQVLDNVVQAGYFVRKRMRNDLPGQWSGILSVLYILMARAELTIDRVAYIELDADGQERQLDAGGTAPAAVRIDFQRQPDDGRRLYFFSQDLSDEGLAASPGFSAFVQRLGPYNTFMKSAQYLPHMEGFGKVGELARGGLALLQDDSGVPFADLPESDWQHRLYGAYESTLPAFKDWQQDDLRAAFAEPGRALPLGFRVGYNGETSGGSLTLSTRRAATP